MIMITLQLNFSSGSDYAAATYAILLRTWVGLGLNCLGGGS